jgi:hypothetical protein
MSAILDKVFAALRVVGVDFGNRAETTTGRFVDEMLCGEVVEWLAEEWVGANHSMTPSEQQVLRETIPLFMRTAILAYAEMWEKRRGNAPIEEDNQLAQIVAETVAEYRGMPACASALSMSRTAIRFYVEKFTERQCSSSSPSASSAPSSL